jgi:MFS family permease
MHTGQYTSPRDPHADELGVICPPHTTEAAIIRRIDLTVIPFLCILYLLAFLDRVNIANARSFGLVEDLHLAGVEYNTALTIFFVPYIIFEIPSNIFLKRLSPRLWLSGCMVGFGVVSVCQGLVQSYGGLLTTRFFLGVFEAGMFPGCFYLIGMWYRRSEAQRRYTFFFSSTTLAGAFGGLLASAIGKMDYLRGYRGWRWIFILEGILTVIVAAGFFFLLPSFPEDSPHFSREERDYITARLRVDQGLSAAERTITIRDVGRVFTDYKIYLGGLMYLGLIVPAYSYAFFAPSIISTYGYDAIRTQLFSVPPWACAFAFAMLLAFASDFTRHRFAFAIFAICVSITGFAILTVVHNNRPLQYAALFLITMGTYSAMPIVVCWFQMNLGGHHRRAVGTAWQVGFGNIVCLLLLLLRFPSPCPLSNVPSSLCVGSSSRAASASFVLSCIVVL